MLLLDNTKTDKVMTEAWRGFVIAFKRLWLTWIMELRLSPTRYHQRTKSPRYYGCISTVMRYPDDPRIAFIWAEDGEYDLPQEIWDGFLAFLMEHNATLGENFFWSHRHPLRYSIVRDAETVEVAFGNVEVMFRIIRDVIDHTPRELIPTVISENIIPAQRDDILDIIALRSEGPKLVYKLHSDQQQIDHEEDGQK